MKTFVALHHQTCAGTGRPARRRRWLLLLSLWVSMLVCRSCSRPDQGDTLVVGIAQTVVTLDPAMHRDRTTEAVLRNVFDGLVTRDVEGRVVPQMAESWRLVDDRTWEFRLRTGIRFHDGTEFTADDVKFTIDRIIIDRAVGGRSSPRRGLISEVDGAQCVGRYTVRIHTRRPCPSLVNMLPFIEVVPKAYVERVGDAYSAEHPVGAGPFAFVEWRKGEHVMLRRFEDYYGGSPEIPPVRPARARMLVFKPIPEPATRVAALKANECELIQGLPPHLVPNIQRDARTRLLACPGTRTFYLGMNVTRPPFQDIRVRHAMNHAVDPGHICRTILEGSATVLAGPLVPGAIGFDPDLKPYRPDLGRARQLLAEAGYPDGFEVTLDATQDMRDVAMALRDQLARAGVRAQVLVREMGLLRADLAGGRSDLFLANWGNASLDPVGILDPTLATGGRGNYTGYSSPRVDALLQQAMTEMDQQRRRSLYAECARVVHADAPWVFLFTMNELYAARTHFQGWQPTPDGWMCMHDAYRVRGRSG
jgi:peptide/nickel transport system substrate-binding protein